MKITVSRITWRRATPWLLHYRPGGTDGPQVRRFFRTKLEADEQRRILLASAATHGRTGLMAMTPAEVGEYREAKRIASDADLRVVARDWAARQPDPLTAPSLTDALAHWLDAQRGASPRYRESISGAVKRLIATLGAERLVPAINATEIETAINQPGVAIETLANRRRMFGTFMAHCRRMGWRTDDPMQRVRRWTVARGTPQYYTVEETGQLLRALHATAPQLLPAMALRLFAGVRTQELRRMVTLNLLDDIRSAEKRILIRAEVAKGRRSAPRPRVIEGLPNNLWRWLALGPVVWPVHAPRLLREALGTTVRRIKNGPRHTFATYAVAHFDSTESVARKLGNSAAVALRHYVGVATKAQAKAFFAISPEGWE